MTRPYRASVCWAGARCIHSIFVSSIPNACLRMDLRLLMCVPFGLPPAGPGQGQCCHASHGEQQAEHCFNTAFAVARYAVPELSRFNKLLQLIKYVADRSHISDSETVSQPREVAHSRRRGQRVHCLIHNLQHKFSSPGPTISQSEAEYLIRCSQRWDDVFVVVCKDNGLYHTDIP